MVHTDLSLPELVRYRATFDEPADFDDFWADTLADARRHELAASFDPVDTGLTAVRTFDVTYRGFGGHEIKGWLHLPVNAPDRAALPGVVQFQGYGGGRGLSHENLLYALAGYAHLVMDTRGQGSGWSVGDTPDPVGAPPSQPGFLTRGIEDPAEYFYRRVFTDGVRAVEALRSHPAVDASRVAVAGGSQGGAITLAVAALLPDVTCALPDVPFLCDFRRATDICDSEPYSEIVRYLKAHRDRVEQAFSTLAYFDGVAMARRAQAPALFSVGLMDQTCPPSTVYAAYNEYAGDKQISVYQFNDHEGGAMFHEVERLQWLRKKLS
ncbi:MAG TPA: acetylxylan esterase [Acidothermaceae bacterium]